MWNPQVSLYKAQKEAGRFFFHFGDNFIPDSVLSGAKTCIVTERTNAVDWHHIDNNSKNNQFIGNLVPLARDLNEAIKDNSPEKFARNQDSDLHPNNLKKVAICHWRKGRFAFAYGVNRLGAFLSQNRPNYNKNIREKDLHESLEFSIESLHAVRALWECGYAVDVLERNIEPLLKEVIGLNLRLPSRGFSLLCKELGAYCIFMGDLERYEAWHALGQVFPLYADGIERPSQQGILLQHRAIALLKQDKMSIAAGILDDAQKCLEEGGDYRGILNNLLHVGLVHIKNKEFDEAEAVIAQMLSRYHPMHSKSV